MNVEVAVSIIPLACARGKRVDVNLSGVLLNVSVEGELQIWGYYFKLSYWM